jgi:hypothetical protein
MPDGVQPHVYASEITDDGRFRENVLAFAKRHDFDIAGPSLDPENPEADRDWLRDAADADLDVMINNGRVEATPERLLEGGELAGVLEELQDLLSVYTDYYPEGHVFMWHEEPLFGDWGGDSLADRAERMVEYGPEIYTRMYDAAKSVAPDLNVGIFVHQPFLPGPEHTDLPAFTSLIDDLRDQGAVPDFTYSDLYRGWYEWEGGYEATNEYLHSILSNAKEVTGRPVYYLGQAHNSNNRYTPSKQAIQGNLRAALEADVDGYGWYVRGTHRTTHPRSYNPFLPASGEDEWSDGYNGWIGARDRMEWALALLNEHATGVERSEQFDLWVHGHDMDLHETRVELETADGWEYVGDVAGYTPGPTVYDPTGREWVSVLHGLDRERYLDGDLSVRLTGHEDGDGADIRGVHAVPYSGTTHYRTEPDLADAIDELDLDALTLGAQSIDATVDPGDVSTATVSIEYPDRVVEETPLAVESPDLGRLADLEAGMDDHTEFFDLWVYGDGLEDARLFLQDSGYELSETELTDRAEATDSALVVRGLEKDDFYNYETTGHFLWPRVEGGDVRAVYLMPYHGTDNIKTPGDIADIVESEFTERQGTINRFAIGAHVSPVGPSSGDFEAWVDADHRHIYEQKPFDYHPSLPWPPWYAQ